MFVPLNQSSINEKMITAALDGDLEVVKALLTQVDPDLKDENGWTILMLAARGGHLEVVKLLLAKADPNLQNELGLTALMVVSEGGYLDIVKEFLKKEGIDLDLKAKNGWTALLFALNRGHFEVIRETLNRGAVAPEVKDKDVETDLMLASREGRLEAVKALLAQADPKIQKENSETALIFAVRFGHLDIFREMLNREGIDLDIKYKDGWTALMLALRYGYLDIAKELLKRGADPNIQNRYGLTALMLAARFGHLDIIKDLLKKEGIDLNAINKEGMSAIMIAIEYGRLEVVREFLNRDGIGLDLKDKDGWTLLMLAARYGHLEIVGELLARGADPNIQNEYGETALMLASRERHPEVVKVLLAKANPDLKDEKGWTALMMASRNWSIKVVKALLAKANPDIQNEDGQTALMVELIKKGHYDYDIAEELINKRETDLSIQNKAGWTALMVAAGSSSLDFVKKLLKKKGIALNAKNKDGMSAIMIAIEYGRPNIAEELAKHGAEKVIGSLARVKTAELDLSQNNHLKKIRTYLTDLGRDEKFIKQFEKGYCGGISSLWAYSKWLQTQPNPENKQRDDHEWFKSTVALIAGWDGKRELTNEEKQEFERFIYHIQLFQYPEKYLSTAARGRLEKSLEDTRVGEGRKLRQEYAIGSLFTLEQLQEFLKTENVLQDGRLIYLASHNHATSLFKNGDDYYYFDPNSETGEIKTKSLDEVARLIFMANKFYYNKPSPLGFRIFSFDEKPKASYLPPQEILAKIGPAPDTRREYYCQGRTGLEIAATIGALESVRYFLKRSASSILPRSFIDGSKKRALTYAIYRSDFDVAKEIMKGFGMAKDADYHSELKRMVESEESVELSSTKRRLGWLGRGMKGAKSKTEPTLEGEERWEDISTPGGMI